MTLARHDEQSLTFHGFGDLPIELRQYIGSKLRKDDLLHLAIASKGQWRAYRHQLMNRFMESHRVVQLAGTSNSSFFVTAEGFVYACGENERGDLGVGHEDPCQAPERVPGLSNIKKVSVTSRRVFFLSHQGELYEVRNARPQLLTLPPIEEVRRYSALWGDAYVALAKDGRVYVRGDNVHHRLGVVGQPAQFEPVPGLEKIKSIGLTYRSSYYINEAGKVYVVGSNAHGQLGLGDRMDRHAPVMMPPLSPADPSVKHVWSNGDVTFLQVGTGEVYACGQNDEGQVGVGSSSECHLEPLLISQLENIKKIYFNGSSLYAVAHDGRVYAWGANDQGQLGLGDKKTRRQPTLVEGLPPVDSISLCSARVMFYAKTGETYACGTLMRELPGMGGAVSASSVPILVPSLLNVRRACNGAGLYTFLRHDGVVVGWGDNRHHALGLDDVYFGDVQFMELPSVKQYLLSASPAVLLHYANQGADYYHDRCFDRAVSLLPTCQSLAAVEEVLPLLVSDRCKQNDDMQRFFPGFEWLLFCDAVTQHIYARLLVIFKGLSGSLKSDIEQQHRFIAMLQAVRPSQESAGQERDRQRRISLRGLQRFGAFASELREMPASALQKAADILADRLPVLPLPDLKRSAEGEVKEVDKKYKRPKK